MNRGFGDIVRLITVIVLFALTTASVVRGDDQVTEEQNQQQVLQFNDTEYADALYTNALSILNTLPREPREIPLSRGRTHKVSHKLSGPAQVIDYISDQLHRYIDIKGMLNGRTSEYGYYQERQRQIDEADRKKKLEEAELLLDQSMQLGSYDALYLLADMNFYGNYTYTRSFPRALELYEIMADATGNSSAQFMVGLAYSTGLFGAVPVDQTKATLYYTFAAEGGDIRAQMAMAFRYVAGIATSVNHQKANRLYRNAAAKAIEYFLDGPGPTYFGTVHLGRNAWVIPDELQGGLFGDGSSEVSSGHAAREKRFPNGVNSIEQALEYFHYLADESDSITAHYALSLLYYDGGRYFEPDYKKSLEYALKCASHIWTTKGTLKPAVTNMDSNSVKIGGSCAGIIGQRYLRGEGVEQRDPQVASVWFRRGVQLQDRISENGLGVLHLLGLGGVDKDEDQAIKLFKSASEKRLSHAQLNMAKVLIDKGQIAQSHEYMKLAAGSGSVEAWYHMGVYYSEKHAFEESNAHFKRVSEQVDIRTSPLKWAQECYRDGDVELASLGFLIAAEQGFESAQMNVAFLLDDHSGVIKLPSSSNSSSGRSGKSGGVYRYLNSSLHSALVYWTRSSKQFNLDAAVRMGDYYLEGTGTDQDSEKAAACYSAAADGPNGLGIARWNLGWMHEQGIGVAKDYHLAKRYYDLALITGPEAFLPVKLALVRLYIKSYWNWITGGKIRGIIQESQPKHTLKEYWETFWKKWSEMDFKAIGEFEEDLFGSNNEELDDEGVLISFMALFAFGLVFIYLWYRQRRQLQQRQQQRDNQQRNNRNNNNDENNNQAGNNHNLRRPFGPNLGHPDQNAVPGLYM